MGRLFLEFVRADEELLQGRDFLVAQAEEVVLHDARIEHRLRQPIDDVRLPHAVAYIQPLLLGDREKLFLGECGEHGVKRRRQALFVRRFLQAFVQERSIK